MKIIKIVFVLLTLSFLFLTSCLPAQPPESAANQQTTRDGAIAYSICPTGVHYEQIAVTNTIDDDLPFGSNFEFLIVPNEGCKLPVQRCSYVLYGSGGGLSCNEVELPKD